MEKVMITVETEMQLSMERLEAIFSVPRTKELFEKFIKQESNEKKIKELATRAEKIFDELEKKSDEEDNHMMTSVESVKHRIKLYILADSIEQVVNGKPLNQAIQDEIQSQLEKAVSIEKVEKDIAGMEIDLLTMNLVKRLLS